MPYDPIESASTGAVKGALDWGLDKVKELASKFKNKKLAFIQDEKTIELVKQLYASGELDFYKGYIKDDEILFLLRMGLTLRKLDKENETDRRRNLRTKIHDKYKTRGLHIAQFVENGLLTRYIGILIEDMTSVDEFKKEVMTVLENIEKYVYFVKKEDKESDVIQKVTIVISVNPSMIFIVSGIYSAAEIVRKCESRLTEFLKDYSLEKISSENKENLFFKRKIDKE